MTQWLQRARKYELYCFKYGEDILRPPHGTETRIEDIQEGPQSQNK